MPRTRAAFIPLVLVLATALAGCAARPGPETLDPAGRRAAGNTSSITVLTATDRSSTDLVRPVLGSGRGILRYEQFTMQAASADGGRAGAVVNACSSDPSKDFITVGRRELDEKAFEDSVNRMQKDAGGTVAVFVHGYNYSYQEAVLRLAQLSAEVDGRVVPILFSWPSQASVRGYVADRDSATYARDDLVHLLATLSRSRTERRVIMIGHSLGAWLVMEALRQLRLQGRDGVISRLQVGLAAPDIDVDVFRTQAALVGRLSPPLTVLVSEDDRALAASSRLANGRPRLGAARVDDPEIQEISRRGGIRIIDITTLPAGNAFNHDRFATFAARYFAAAQDGHVASGVRQAGVYLLDTTGRLLSGPFNQTARIIAGSQ